MVPQRGPHGESFSIFRAIFFVFIHISHSPQLWALPRNTGTTYGHRPRNPTRTEGLHTMGCRLVPQGDRLRHCYHYPITMQPSARYLPPWLRYTRARFASVCRSNPHQVIPSTPVTAFHVTQGTDLHITLRYGRGDLDLWETSGLSVAWMDFDLTRDI